MKTPTPRKLSSGRWFIQLRLNGESIPITAETKTECLNIAELTKAEYRSGKRAIKKTPKNITLQESMNKYIEKNRATMSPTTVRSYQSYAKNRFIDYQDKALKDINWQEMINKELNKVSSKTVKNAWRLVTPALRTVGYPIPEVRLAPVPVSDRISFIQPEEILQFCDAVKGRSYEIPVLLELHGLRLSEVRALDWKNVNVDKGTITIRGAKVRGENGDVIKETNKNDTSSRTIPIMIPQLLTALQDVKDKTGLVANIGANTLLDDVKRSCRRAGIHEITNHDLRRSFASLCFFLKIPEQQIMEWGGWGDRATLRRVYLMLAASTKSESKDAFTGFFKNENANKTLTASSNHQ